MARILHSVRTVLRRYFVAGILTFAPIGITIWAIAWIVQRLDNLLLPRVLNLLYPGVQDPPSIPFLGAIFTLIVILLFGVVARHLFGWELVRIWEQLLSRVPVARNIYAAVKQLAEAIFRDDASSTNFRGVAVIEYPRKGLYALAFVTGPVRGLPLGDLPERLVNVFVPTTPNPTSGFYLLVPEEDLRPVDLTVEDAFKLVMSAGLVNPGREGDAPAAIGEPVAPPAGLGAPSPGGAGR